MTNTEIGMKQKISKRIRENWKRINALMDLRQKQFLEIYQENWYHYLIEDEMYKMLCGKLVEIKMSVVPTYVLNRKITDEEVKQLASGCITVEDYIKELKVVQPYDKS